MIVLLSTMSKKKQIELLLFIARSSYVPYDYPLSVFDLIHLNRNRIGRVLNLPDFVHFDPLGQQIKVFLKLNSSLSSVYNLSKLRADKSGTIVNKQ